jgi:hypothetical protein|eukprot:COSAG02_NODE_1269_length_13533_cov_7.935016_3_plen_116_part_00
MLFAEPRAHRRPFPKRRAIPFDRWRNSGGKRGSTAVKGRQVMMLRRYGNVVIHERDPIRYVEYSVLSDECSILGTPNATCSGTPPHEGSCSAEENREITSARGTKRPLEDGVQHR